MIQLVQFRCGCIGSLPVDGKTQIILADTAEERCLILEYPAPHGMPVLEPGSYSAKRQEEEGYNAEGWRPLSEDRYNEVIRDMVLLIRQGHRYRQIKQALAFDL